MPFDKCRTPRPASGDHAHDRPMKSFPTRPRVSKYQSLLPESVHGVKSPRSSAQPLGDVLSGTIIQGAHQPSYPTLPKLKRECALTNQCACGLNTTVPVYSPLNFGPLIEIFKSPGST